MHDSPDAEVDPPLLLKALGLVMGTCFAAAAVLVARDALGKPFAVTPWLLVPILVALAGMFIGLLVWRTRLYVEKDSVVVERRGYFGTIRRTVAAAEVELVLERSARWGLLAKAVVPRFVVRTSGGEVLLQNQGMGVEQLAERIAEKMGQLLRVI